MKNYQAAQYKGHEWGLFAIDTRNWLTFGTKRAMLDRAKVLNDQVMMTNELRQLGRNLEELSA